MAAPDPHSFGGRGTLAQRTLSALAQVVHSNAGGVWIANEEGRYVPSGGDLAGPDSPSEPAESEFLRFIAAREWIVDLHAHRRGAVADASQLKIPGWLLQQERAWLVVPLLQEERLVAFVVVAQSLAPQDLTWEDLDL